MKYILYVYDFCIGMITGLSYFISYGVVYYVLNKMEQRHIKDVSEDTRTRNSCFNWGILVGAIVTTCFIYVRFFH